MYQASYPGARRSRSRSVPGQAVTRGQVLVRLKSNEEDAAILDARAEVALAKGDKDAATWLPPNRAFRCEYVARQTAVKATSKLWVTQAEHDAIVSILEGCR